MSFESLCESLWFESLSLHLSRTHGTSFGMAWQAFVQLHQQLFLREGWDLVTLRIDLHAVSQA